MKPTIIPILLLGLTLWHPLATYAAEAPPTPKPPEAPPDAAAAAATTAAAAPTTPDTTAAPLSDGSLRLNFRGAPLDLVLNYLSEAAGFIIILDTDVKGKVDVWSDKSLTKDEAVEVLNSVLNQNGYAAVRKGRTLTIVSRDEAKKRNIPVKSGNKPDSIPDNDEMVTQIIPVKYANASQLIKDLQPLLPTYANMTANESGNALVITDTQSDVRRMAEVVQALDTSISSVSAVRVFPLRYADAKDLANAVKELFTPPTSQQGNVAGGPFGGGRAQLFNQFFGGGGRGGGGAGGGAGAAGGSGTGGGANTRVVAVADERTNSLIVSAPEESISTIEQLVKEIDTPASDVTELRVFHLLNADPTEMADLFTQIFPDDTKSTDQNQNQGFRFGRGPFGFGGAAAAAGTASDRLKKKGRVLAVADARTSSIVVSAASELMPQIAEMIQQLDASSTKHQKVYVYSLENADVQEVMQVLQDMFQRTTTQMNRNSSSSTSPLLQRSQQNTQSGYGSSTLGTRNSGFGSGGLGGAGLGGGTLR